MGNTGPKLIVVAVLAIAGYLGYRFIRPTPFPNVTVMTREEVRHLAELPAGKSKLVLALLIPGDPVSKAACQKLKAAYEARESRVAFAAVQMSDARSAEDFQKDNELPFPVYSLEPRENPIEYNAVVEAVGGFRRRFYGGTVLMLNPKLGIVEQVNGNELMGLDAELSRL